MTEIVFVLLGVVLAACAGFAAMAWHLALAARDALQTVRNEARAQLEGLTSAAAGIAEEHNALVKTQAEQAQTLERLGAEIAGRSLRR